MKNNPAKPVKKPAPKKRKAAQSPVTLDKAQQEPANRSGEYTEQEFGELLAHVKETPSTWAFAYFGAIAALPAGKLIAHWWENYQLRAAKIKATNPEKLADHMKEADAETGRMIREQLKRGSDPALFFSNLALWFKTPGGSGKRRALKLRDFGVTKRGRQKQPTDNRMLFAWAVVTLVELRNMTGRRDKITHDELREKIADYREFAGGEGRTALDDAQFYKLIKESGYSPFVE